ncbi:tyrosine decarboxylase MnfA [Propionibacterium sp. oral taxon 192 str. F0372]|nr:tyrosine decarboxylase MnfA [Propionibacterium sp. oral taxon 192 str. F0372]
MGMDISSRPVEWASLSEITASDVSFEGGAIFNSICTRPHPLAAQVMADNLHLNAGDGRLFPSVARCESEITNFLGGLMGLPRAVGMCTSGATEANLIAVHSAIENWRRKGGQGRPQVILGRGGHFSFDKISVLLGVELVLAWSDIDTLKVDPESVSELISPRTALIVATAGSSETGAVDDVEWLSRVALSKGVPLHVDAASGGLLIPFLRDLGGALPDIGFRNDGVTTIAIDPHKFGSAPIPSGHLVAREWTWIEGLRTESHYQGTARHLTFLGTRSGGSILATYALFGHLGEKGLRGMAEQLKALRSHLVDRLRKAGATLAYVPELMVVALKADSDAVKVLERRGIFTSYAKRLGYLRIVVQLHMSEGQVDGLVDALLMEGIV